MPHNRTGDNMESKQNTDSMTEEELDQAQPSTEETEAETPDLQTQLDEAMADVQKYKDEYIRTHADFENSKKRLEKEKATAVAFANEGFASDMLGVLDSLEKALESASELDTSSEGMKNFIEGIELTYDQVLKALSRNGVEQIDTQGEFDPNLHQALMQVDSDEHKTGEIVTVMQKGYTIKDRILRPAMISTAK